VHIRTDDEVYRVDAVWLGPPRATFPWRARYSAYGVGLLVMIVTMFLQRRLGIPLGFFSVAWALLITVLITRFVSRRINDERPLLEWLTLFAHELRGPRARTRSVGGALTTGHVRVHRDRPQLTAAPTAIALPRGSTPADSARVVRPRTQDTPDGPPPRSRRRGSEAPEQTHAPSHRSRRRTEGGDRPARPRRKADSADAGFGPPSATEIGDPVESRPSPQTEGHDDHDDHDEPARPAALPSASATPSAGMTDMAAWTGTDREPVPVRARRIDARDTRDARDTDAGRGGFGPGARRTGPRAPRRPTDEDDGARP
jgi:hypothetical protein